LNGVTRSISIDESFNILLVYKKSSKNSTYIRLRVRRISKEEYILEYIGFFHPKGRSKIFAEIQFGKNKVKITEGDEKLVKLALKSWERGIFYRTKNSNSYKEINSLDVYEEKNIYFQI